MTPCRGQTVAYLWSCVAAWKTHEISQHQAITKTNANLSSEVFCSIPLQAISQEVHRNLIHDVFGDYTFKLLPHVNGLTVKQRETHWCVVSTVATDALVLKHQVISIWLNIHCIGPVSYKTIASENEITFWKKWPSCLRVKTVRPPDDHDHSTDQLMLFILQMLLFTHIRLAQAFSKYEKRIQCVQARLQAISILGGYQ